MTLRTRVLLVVAATLALIALMGSQLFLRYAQATEAVQDVVTTLAPSSAAVADLTSDINAMDRRLRIYVSSGEAGYRVLHQSAVQAARRNVAELEQRIGQRPEYAGLVGDIDTGLQEWLSTVGNPALAAMADDAQRRAQRVVDSPRGRAAHAELTADTFRLATELSADQAATLEASRQATQRLARSMALALVLALLLPIAGFVMLHAQVLRPIDRLRRQLRLAATPGDHQAVIEPEGPPELRDLGADAEALRRALVREIDESDAARSALEQEGPVVAAIRHELAPRTDPQPAGVQIAGLLRPAQGVLAGDFWDRIPLGDGRAAVVLCDVSGHGPRAGIVAMRLKTSITLGLISGQDPAQILHRACDQFADEPGRFATVVVLIADPRRGTIEWVNAGHPAPRVVRADGRIDRLGPTGPMVSWLVGAWRAEHARLGRDDICLLFTDGILESRDAEGDELGDDALDERLRAAVLDTTDPDEVVARVLAGVRARAEDLSRDDVTLVALRLDPAPGTVARPSGSAAATGVIPTPRG
ncbi:MAG TPA: SpoIIE family protein phosphatase [Candidatus Nanopelagicales bacterium]